MHRVGEVTHADGLVHDDALERVELTGIDRELLVLEDDAAQLVVGGTSPDLAPDLANATCSLTIQFDGEVDVGLRLITHCSLG